MACLCTFSCIFFWFAAAIVSILATLKLYIKLTTGWCRSPRCLTGTTAIITGANTGIGYEAALDFAKRGARVILACRDQPKSEDARRRIIEATGNSNVVVKLLDLGSFASVRKFASEITESEERVDILVNNAGTAGLRDTKSEDGEFLVMQINYYSPFLLTNLLLDLLKKSGPSRIINVSSIAAKYAKLDVNKLGVYPGVLADYSNSKLCNILFTQELARQLEGTGVTTYSLHPGAVQTELFRRAEGFLGLVISIAAKLLFKTREEGAQTIVHTSIASGIEEHSGGHFVNCKQVAAYKTATDSSGLGRKLWEKTEDIVKLRH